MGPLPQAASQPPGSVHLRQLTHAHTRLYHTSRCLWARTLTLSVSVSGVNGVGSSGPSEYMEVPLGSLELPSEGTLSPNHAGHCQLLG